MTAAPRTAGAEVIWHDVECGIYATDLEAWSRLAGPTPIATLEIGAGTGRVALDLLARGHRVTGLDIAPSLVAELGARAAARGQSDVSVVTADARAFDLRQRFDLIVLPMQVLQLFADAGERTAVLSAARRHLASGGRVAAAIVEGSPLEGRAGGEYEPPLPDVADVDGWIYSSLPLEVVRQGDRMLVTRLRQIVDPDGELTEDIDRTSLAILTGVQLAQEAEAAGLRITGELDVPESADHVGSTIVVMESA